jgi:hypothetical protein
MSLPQLLTMCGLATMPRRYLVAVTAKTQIGGDPFRFYISRPE